MICKNDFSISMTEEYSMSFWKIIFGTASDTTNESQSTEHNSNDIVRPEINPATGLPMLSGMGSTDVGGDVFGSSTIHDSLFDENNSSTFDSFDDNHLSSFDPFDDNHSSSFNPFDEY